MCKLWNVILMNSKPLETFNQYQLEINLAKFGSSDRRTNNDYGNGSALGLYPSRP